MVEVAGDSVSVVINDLVVVDDEDVVSDEIDEFVECGIGFLIS